MRGPEVHSQPAQRGEPRERLQEEAGTAVPCAGGSSGSRESAASADPQTPTAGTLQGTAIPCWLQGLDGGKGLLLAAFGEALQSSCSSVEDVLTSYRIRDAAGGPDVLNAAELKRFFGDMGIEKIGHRRTFEKWFREHFQAESAAGC